MLVYLFQDKKEYLGVFFNVNKCSEIYKEPRIS